MESGSYLYSENARNQGGGSGQQLVTFSPHHVNSEKTLWWLHGSSNENCTTATPIACGSVVRLSHVPTKRNLHSHNVVSSLSRQQEVTAWGDNYEGDGGDDWKVVCPTRYWERTTTVRLWHRDTQRYLGAASNVNYNVKNCGQECPILDHLEAFGRKQADEYGDFQVESGLFIGG
jgi:dolichyl-phosphate-mannose--protein O-mannosyl transferase